MSKTAITKTAEPIYVIRTVTLPLSGSELESRKSELPLVISQEGQLAIRRKSLLSALKEEADDLGKKRETLVREINTRERVEDLRCLKTPVVAERCWQIIHPTTGEILERIPMTWEQVEKLSQTEIPLEQDEDEAPNSSDEKSDADEDGGSFRLLALPEPPPAPPAGEDPPRLIAAPDVEIIEGEIVELESIPDTDGSFPADSSTDDHEDENDPRIELSPLWDPFIIPAKGRSATDQASDFAAQLVGGGA